MDCGIFFATSFVVVLNGRLRSSKSLVFFTGAPSANVQRGLLAQPASLLRRFSKRSSAKPLHQEARHTPSKVLKACVFLLGCRLTRRPR